jgi:hypothetical protein
MRSSHSGLCVVILCILLELCIFDFVVFYPDRVPATMVSTVVSPKRQC